MIATPPELGGGEWHSISNFFHLDGTLTAANQGSPYVPIDSWIYPAFDRLIGMGMIDSGYTGVRPWTRSECARILTEASDRIDPRARVEYAVSRLRGRAAW